MRTRALAALAASALAALGLSSCIERAPTPASRRAAFDRSELTGDVILSQRPDSALGMGAIFDESVELAGYEFSPSNPKSGTTVNVTFYWRVFRPPEQKYRIFVHAENINGEGRLGADHWPARGRYSTEMWQAGEVIRDSFRLVIPQNFEGEGLAVWTGFYFPKKQDVRMPLTSAGMGRSDGKNRVRAFVLPINR